MSEWNELKVGEGGGARLDKQTKNKSPPHPHPRSDDYDDYIWRGTKFINYQIKLSAR